MGIAARATSGFGILLGEDRGELGPYTRGTLQIPGNLVAGLFDGILPAMAVHTPLRLILPLEQMPQELIQMRVDGMDNVTAQIA